jgi:hypothetical protein
LFATTAFTNSSATCLLGASGLTIMLAFNSGAAFSEIFALVSTFSSFSAMSLTRSFTFVSLGTSSQVFALSLAFLYFSALSLTRSFTAYSL